MQKRNSEICSRGVRRVMSFMFCLFVALGMTARARPAEANLCGMVSTPTGDEFWGPCSSQSNAPQAPPKPDVWGAIAVSPTTLVWGNSWNYPTAEEAGAKALEYCLAHSEVKDCKIVLKVADICVALAVSIPEKLYIIGGPTGATNFAADNATLKCRRAGGHACTIEASFCADGVDHVINGSTNFSNGNPIFTPSGQSSTLRR